MKEAILIIVCILFYGTGTFFKRLGLLQLHPYQFLLLTGVCYALFIPVWYWLLNYQPVSTTYSAQNSLFVVIYAIFSVSAGLILAFLLQNTKAPGTLIVMTNLSSLVTFLLCCVFLNEQLTVTKIIAVVFAILSLFLINY